MAPLSCIRRVLLLGLLCVGLIQPRGDAAGAAATEHQVKAVFVFNFSHFADWPPAAFDNDTEPFVIGVLGSDAFGATLEEVVRGERVDGHPIVVRRFPTVDAIGASHILFIDRSESAHLKRVVELVKGSGTLTVSDLDGATQQGVMIQLANVSNRIRLRVNVDSARAAGLVLSSNLLRSAEIVRTATQN